MNQRIIKFRAWDKDEKKMHGWELVRPMGFYEFDKISSCYIFMQWTGLHDKNGVEIYEGDIILFPDTYTETVDVGVDSVPVAQMQENSFYAIEFQEGEFGINVTGETEVVYKGWQSLRELKASVDYEVIGNIFSNPELLYDSK